MGADIQTFETNGTVRPWTADGSHFVWRRELQFHHQTLMKMYVHLFFGHLTSYVHMVFKKHLSFIVWLKMFSDLMQLKQVPLG